jgi:hypothetical protein
MALGLAGCEPPETWWPTVLDGPELQGPRTTAIVGDFDEDGLDDLFWYAAGSAGPAEELWTARPEGGFDRGPAPSVSGSYHPVAGDFDGDGDDDILWAGDGSPGSVWSFEGGVVTGKAPVSLPHVADPSRIVVVERSSGPDHVAMALDDPGSGTTVEGVYVWDPLESDWLDGELLAADTQTWVQTGDFDGDGHGDLFLYGAGSRRDTIGWGRPDGDYDTQAITITGAYVPVALDADGDGRDDVAFFTPSGQASSVPLWKGRPGRWFARTTTTAPTLSGDPWVQGDRGDGRANVLIRARDAAQIWSLDAAGTAVVRNVVGPSLGVPEVGHFSDADRDDLYVWGYGRDRLLLSPRASG